MRKFPLENKIWPQFHYKIKAEILQFPVDSFAIPFKHRLPLSFISELSRLLKFRNRLVQTVVDPREQKFAQLGVARGLLKIAWIQAEGD